MSPALVGGILTTGPATREVPRSVLILSLFNQFSIYLVFSLSFSILSFCSTSWELFSAVSSNSAVE